MADHAATSFPSIQVNKRSLSSRKLVYGVGVNDANYLVQPTVNGEKFMCQFYQTWWSMLARCFSLKLRKINPTYANCSVTKNWLIFSNFRRWMERQDWQGKQLDKDLLIPGNKVYSPGTCMFVAPQINSLLTAHGAKRGNYPQGTHWCKQANKYQAKMGKYGKSKNLGYFDTAEEASAAHKKAKSDHVKNIAMQQTEPLKSALIKQAELIKVGAV